MTQTADIPAGMIEIHARRGEHTLRVYAAPEGNARRLTRQLAVALLATCGEIILADDPDEGVFARPQALNGVHALILQAKSRAQMDLDALTICPTCLLGLAPGAAIGARTWAELGYHAGDRLTLCVTGDLLANVFSPATGEAVLGV